MKSPAQAPRGRRASRELGLGYTLPPLTELGMLGQGACGYVRPARPREGGQMVAVKCLPKGSADARGAAVREARMMRSLDHDSICSLREVCEDQAGVYLVLEYIEGRELFEQIGAFGLADKRAAPEIMRQLLEALAHCHENGVVHLDVKPENVMVVEPSLGESPAAKLIDFGLAVRAASPAPAAAGVGPYSAPEVRGAQPAQPSADVWSAGAVLHALLTGALPPPSVSEGLEPLDVHSAALAAVDPAARELLRDLLSPDPSSRPRAKQAATHPWLCSASAWSDGASSAESSPCGSDLDSVASTCCSPLGAYPSERSCLCDVDAAACTVDEAWLAR